MLHSEARGIPPPAHPPMTILHRILRGGYWFFGPGDCRSARRIHRRPVLAHFSVGFRVVCLPARSPASAHPLMDLLHRVLRGGSWVNLPRYCRSALRYHNRPDVASYGVGFRVVCPTKTAIISHFLPLFNMNNLQDLIPLVEIPAGEFLMGSPDGDSAAYDDERPQHRVTVPALQMGRTPVTQAQWRAVAALPRVKRDLNPNPSYHHGDDHPVERVSWHDAMEFCERLSRATGRIYTLPSEAQWEYACRAGTTTPYNCGETISTSQANFNGNCTTSVGSYSPNAWGLCDMHGNVWEWCLDQWHDSYEGAPTDGSAWQGDSLGKVSGADPVAAIPGTADRLAAATSSPAMPAATSVSASAVKRLLRGGCWFHVPHYCRSAFRDGVRAANLNGFFGFRVCCLPQP